MYVGCIRRERRGERGSIMIMTAIFALLLLLMVGLCLDVSRIYIVRAELQNAADAAALAAARELNGGTGGIDDAVLQATSVIVNTQGLRAKTGVDITAVEFAVNLNDNPYLNATTAKANAAQIRFVKVTTQSISTNILFASSALGLARTESRQAVAGMSVGLSGICDFFPAAVALLDPSPTPGTPLTLKFTQGTGTSATINDGQYIILSLVDSGGVQVGTSLLAAGLPNFCLNLGANIAMTLSLDPNNGPGALSVGMNTRFDSYVGGQLTSFPPDSNINESITYTQYSNKSPLTPPNTNPPGQNGRRILVAPIIAPGTYPYTTNGFSWGIFFLKSKVQTDGDILVEYVGRANVAASGSPTCSSGLTTPVLYK